MPVRKQALKRVPLGSREVQIIRRLKRVIKLPVTKIALAVQRNKSSVYKALRPSFAPAKRGPKNKVTQKDILGADCEGDGKESGGEVRGHIGDAWHPNCSIEQS